MVSEEELEGFRKDRYFARSWALLTRHRGWVKPVLLLTLCLLVPVVGWFGVLGYVLEWARLTAWGVNAAPKQSGVRVGECIASGARAFVVLLVWNLVAEVIVAALSCLPLLDDVLDVLWRVLRVPYSVIVMVAVLRATIYRRIVPGFRAGHVWKMVRHDPVGLLRCLGIMLLGGLVMGVLASVVTFSVVASVLPALLRLLALEGEYAIGHGVALGYVALALEALASLGPLVVVLLLAMGFLGVITVMLGYTSLALWTRQFDVPAWRGDKDPLPDFLSDPRDAAGTGAGASASGSWQGPEPVGADADGAGGAEFDESRALPPAPGENGPRRPLA